MKLPKEGDLGPIWISVGGGGLGSLGELGGRAILIYGNSWSSAKLLLKWQLMSSGFIRLVAGKLNG